MKIQLLITQFLQQVQQVIPLILKIGGKRSIWTIKTEIGTMYGFMFVNYPQNDSGMNFETFINMNSGHTITSLWFDFNGGTWIPDGWNVVIDTGSEQIELDIYNLPYQDNPLEFSTPAETLRFIWTQVSSWDSPSVYGIQFIYK